MIGDGSSTLLASIFVVPDSNWHRFS